MGGSAGRAPLVEFIGGLLRFTEQAGWLLVFNAVQNLLFAPRASGDLAALRRRRPPETWPSVSILVPARDEGENIGGCLGGLLDQTYPVGEILVLDDRSADDTAAIVRALAATSGAGHLRLLAGRARPAGWSGKNWACRQLADEARGEWLLMVDADTRLRPAALAAALEIAWRYDADLVSLIPRHRTDTLGERLVASQLPLVVFGFLPLALVPRPWRWTRPFAGANGLFLFIRRAWYDALGGHEAVRGLVAEDMAFAVATKARGGIVALADGRHLLDVRMYDGFAASWRGLTRNAFSAVLGSSPAFFMFTGVWAFWFALPPLVAVTLLVARRRGPVREALLRLALRAMGGQFALRGLMVWRNGNRAWEIPLQPLSSVLMLGVLLDSYRRHRLGGGFEWRGVRYR
jgi:chlorobactene glucosyltransferase